MLIDRHLKFQLPQPWNDQIFETDKIGPINFIVGPNGSGKSQFAKVLLGQYEKSGLGYTFPGDGQVE